MVGFNFQTAGKTAKESFYEKKQAFNGGNAGNGAGIQFGSGGV
jgi:hypothetical protein